jgi:hypothetical protein
MIERILISYLLELLTPRYPKEPAAVRHIIPPWFNRQELFTELQEGN